MALKKTNQAAATSFEQEPGTASADTAVAEREAPQEASPAPAPVAPTPAPEPTAAAKVETTVALAKASSSSLSTNDAANAAKNFKKEVEAMKGAADFSYGSHRVFKAKDGVIKESGGDKTVLGRWVKGRLLAWDRHFEISPGEDGKDSGSFVAYSLDGVTIDNVIGEDLKSWEGKHVDDYVTYLRDTEEFDKASKREFIDTEVAVLGCEDEADFTGVIQITLSSSSIPAFKKYQSDLESTAKCVAMGLPGYKLPDDPFSIYFIRESAEKGKNSWTKLRLAATLPAKL